MKASLCGLCKLVGLREFSTLLCTGEEY